MRTLPVKSRLRGLSIAAAALVAAAAVSLTAVPANAVIPTAGTATSTDIVSTSQSARVLETPAAPGPVLTRDNTALVVPSAVSPNYAAGAKYYVCVSTNGSTLAVLYNQSVKVQCKGFAAVQIYYDSGQFIKTVQLTPNGTPASHIQGSGGGCVMALVGAAALVLSPELTPIWYVSTIPAAYGLKDCISQ